MSMINAAAPYRREGRHSVRVPVVMPLLQVNVDSGGYLEVTLDGEPYSADGRLQRDDLSGVLDEVASDLGTPVRVEVRETDGSTFADIITPASGPSAGSRAVPNPGPTSTLNTPRVFAGEVSGGGFLPKEEVAVAIVVGRQVANADGTARLRLPPALFEAHQGLVVLLGQTSGTVAATVNLAGGAA